jgi:hypothetical protein
VSPPQDLLYQCYSVMPGLVPGIYIFNAAKPQDVDGRDKPGHDEPDPEVYILAPVGYFVLPRFD